MTTNPQFRGVYAIPVTPFNDDLSVDWDSLRKCVEFSVEAGAHGIVVPVNASEGPFLTDTERKQVLKVAIEVVDGAVPVVGGVSGTSTTQSVDLTRNAAELGADSVMAMPPNGATSSIMWDHFAAIAEAGQLPVWIQNNKPPAGPIVPTDMMVRMLNEVEHVDYVKEESNLPGQVMTELFEKAGGAIRGVMGGMGGRYLVDEYRRGSCGTMPAGHITDAHARLWDALEAGGTDADGLQVVTDEARDIWERMIPSLNFEFMFGANAYKAAYWRRGIIKTPKTRIPANKLLDKFDYEELDRILDRMSDLLSWRAN
ncbi:MAG: dihydrodipicolinate synthase family protein [Dehalococcoidia bacterium]|jgi:4-hydroxy-tetrahydrodipicolinate synthase|nr:dihydrodipicolinate synthase family protein [Dehalococcoidia bacterium]|tara:strand:- start:3914 stop:4852 length:939 start_codon:yes stop_codon:yes gene_type:complete